MQPAPAPLPQFAPLAANDNGPTDTRICRWRLCIDQFKARGLSEFAVYTAVCKLRGAETFDEFAARMIRWLNSEKRALG